MARVLGSHRANGQHGCDGCQPVESVRGAMGHACGGGAEDLEHVVAQPIEKTSKIRNHKWSNANVEIASNQITYSKADAISYQPGCQEVRLKRSVTSSKDKGDTGP